MDDDLMGTGDFGYRGEQSPRRPPQATQKAREKDDAGTGGRCSETLLAVDCSPCFAPQPAVPLADAMVMMSQRGTVTSPPHIKRTAADLEQPPVMSFILKTAAESTPGELHEAIFDVAPPIQSACNRLCSVFNPRF
jgi:hypothetical protein